MKPTFFLPLAILLASCNSDFLERSPEDKVSDGAVWKTPEHLRTYVYNLYNREDLLPSYAANNGSNTMGIFTLDRDNGTDTQIGSTVHARLNGDVIVPGTGGGWSVSDWEALRDINYFFAHYETAAGNQADIDRCVGEALFFRALFYFDKLKSFGNLPIYDKLLGLDNRENLYLSREPRNKVVEWMLADLSKAAQLLPSRAAGWSGRLNRETAMLLMARIALFEGSWEKYHARVNTPFKVAGANGEVFLQVAASVTDTLMRLGTCGLDNQGVANGYWKVFNQENYASSQEVLFWRSYDSKVISHVWIVASADGGNTGLTKRMVDSYLCSDGKPIDISPAYQGDSTLLTVVANRDPRLRQTIYVNDTAHFRYLPATESRDTFFLPSATSVTGYQLYKGHNPNREQIASGTPLGQTALIYFRYAEALLINAEAKAELNLITQTDVDNTINRLRARVGMAPMTLSEVEGWSYTKEFPTLSNTINEIRRERKVELAAEGFRTDDIFRWAAAPDLIRRYAPKGAKLSQWQSTTSDIKSAEADADGYIFPYKSTLPNGYGFNYERDYLKPLPTAELVVNPKLLQNPGW
jgi:hypothetical protein